MFVAWVVFCQVVVLYACAIGELEEHCVTLIYTLLESPFLGVGNLYNRVLWNVPGAITHVPMPAGSHDDRNILPAFVAQKALVTDFVKAADDIVCFVA